MEIFGKYGNIMAILDKVMVIFGEFMITLR